MIKRTLSLAVVAGLVSAGLIFGGTAVMSRIGPLSAAQLPALIAEGFEGESGSGSLPVTSVASNGPSALPQGSPSSYAGFYTQPASNPAVKPGLAVKVTIAELLANPSNYLGRVVSSAGRVTSLGNDKFLINDGTGQIIVDLKDAWEKLTINNGMIVTVDGEMTRIGGGSAFNIAARTVTARSGPAVAGKQAGGGSAGPAPCTGCDDDRDGCDDDDCQPEKKDAPPPPPRPSGDDDNGDDDNDDNDNGDDDGEGDGDDDGEGDGEDDGEDD